MVDFFQTTNVISLHVGSQVLTGVVIKSIIFCLSCFHGGILLRLLGPDDEGDIVVS
jgi:hypothetical protein